ncbi:hypothetical protein WJX72_007416 [[Myrmecia] bisecta]|uniref:Flagellar associated protein n=1 Tax=[Myrmecia] bisecta TaxID=41462 RepID=A0AAW1PPF1_9CHLO
MATRQPRKMPTEIEWADGTLLTEYQKEYYKKEAARRATEQAAKVLSARRGATESTAVHELQAFASTAGLLPAPNSTSHADFARPKSQAAVRVRPKYSAPLPDRPFAAKSTYQSTFDGKSYGKPEKGQGLSARRKAEAESQPEALWFGESHLHADYPDWGKTHQAKKVNRAAGLGPNLPFTATSTQRADFQRPGSVAKRYVRPPHQQVPSMPLTDASSYRLDFDWAGAGGRFNATHMPPTHTPDDGCEDSIADKKPAPAKWTFPKCKVGKRMMGCIHDSGHLAPYPVGLGFTSKTLYQQDYCEDLKCMAR